MWCRLDCPEMSESGAVRRGNNLSEYLRRLVVDGFPIPALRLRKIFMLNSKSFKLGVRNASIFCHGFSHGNKATFKNIREKKRRHISSLSDSHLLRWTKAGGESIPPGGGYLPLSGRLRGQIIARNLFLPSPQVAG